MVLQDENGRPRAVVMVNKDHSSVTFNDEKGTQRVALGVSKNVCVANY